METAIPTYVLWMRIYNEIEEVKMGAVNGRSILCRRRARLMISSAHGFIMLIQHGSAMCHSIYSASYTPS